MMIIKVLCPEWEVRLVKNKSWIDTVYGPITLSVPNKIIEELEIDKIAGSVYVTINKQGYFHSSATVKVMEDQ